MPESIGLGIDEFSESCFCSVFPLAGASGGAIGVNETLGASVDAGEFADRRLRAPMLPK